MQIGNLELRAEVRAVVRADTYAELRAVVRAELCAEKNGTDAEIFAESDADAGAEAGVIVTFCHIGTINVSYCYNSCSLKYKIAPMQIDLQNLVQYPVQIFVQKLR